MGKRTSWKHILTTEFAIQLIKQIPSNLYCSQVLKVPVAAISYKRANMSGAVKAGCYQLSEATKAKFRPILLKIKRELKASRIDSTVTPEETVKKENTIFNNTVIIIINGVPTTVKNNDRLDVKDGVLYLLKAL